MDVGVGEKRTKVLGTPEACCKRKLHVQSASQGLECWLNSSSPAETSKNKIAFTPQATLPADPPWAGKY
jgi:hypothetical protein